MYVDREYFFEFFLTSFYSLVHFLFSTLGSLVIIQIESVCLGLACCYPISFSIQVENTELSQYLVSIVYLILFSKFMVAEQNSCHFFNESCFYFFDVFKYCKK